MGREVYLDNNATTPPDSTVVEAMMPYLQVNYGNASSVHHKGVEAERAIQAQRRRLADLLEVTSDQIYFTSGGTESNNLVIQGAIRTPFKKTQHIITTATEHSSVRDVIRELEGEKVEVTRLYPDKKGKITSQQVVDALRDDTVLVSIMQVNNETGAILPVERMARSVKAHDDSVTFHVDGVQGFGKYPVDVSDIDAYTISGHKIHAPKGIGALYLSDDCHLPPLLIGGGQESGLRSGTENVPGIVGLGKAAEMMQLEKEDALDRLSRLRQEFLERIDGGPEFRINTPLENSLPTTLNLSFPPIPAEVIVHGLSEEGVYVSSGSACANRRQASSHVLEAMGIPEKYIDSSVRFSFSRMTSRDEMQYAADKLKELLPRLEKIARIQNK
jgi:cysteine desulfurase